MIVLQYYIGTASPEKDFMMYKIVSSLLLAFFLFTSPLFAQGSPMIGSDIDVYIKVISQDSPEEREKTAKESGVDDAHMQGVVQKLSAIYVLKGQGLSGQALIDGAKNAGITLTQADLDVYETKASTLEPAIKKIFDSQVQQ
jgi:hypothetical protein